MTKVEEYKKAIAEFYEIPAGLITGETEEEVLAHAKSLVVLRNETRACQGLPEQKPPTRELFAAWFSGEYKPAEPEKEEPKAPDNRPNREKFAAWFTGEE